MSAESDIYSTLAADAGVGAICADRIYPLHVPQGNTLPAISYQRVSTNHVASLGGDTSNLDQVRIQIDMWSKSYEDVKSLSAAVRSAMKSLVALPQDSSEFYEEETEIYRSSYDFYVWDNPV